MAYDLFSVEGFFAIFSIYSYIFIIHSYYLNYPFPGVTLIIKTLYIISTEICINKCLLNCNMPKLKAKPGTIYFPKFHYLKKPGRRLHDAVN